MFEKIVNENNQITTITVEWKDDFGELMSVLKTFFDDNNTEHLLLDLRDSFLDSLSHDNIKDLCKYATSRADDNGGNNAKGKTALVCSSDLQFGIGEIFKTYSEMEDPSINFSVFRSMDRALSWLEKG